MTIPWPNASMSFLDFADSLRLTRPDLEIQPIINKDTSWQAWASQLIQSQACQNVNAPRPDGYSDWRSWSEDFIRCFGVTG